MGFISATQDESFVKAKDRKQSGRKKTKQRAHRDGTVHLMI